MKREDIERLAKLARIEVTEVEANALAEDITSILGYISEINDMTGSSEGEKRLGAVYNVFREDTEPHESGLYTEALLAEAPERDGQYFKVKKILENKK
jgi:aspartyl-tRNA(Asn)/glutamyl-tRNA(Gln) amidotransferase subunit C